MTTGRYCTRSTGQLADTVHSLQDNWQILYTVYRTTGRYCTRSTGQLADTVQGLQDNWQILYKVYRTTGRYCTQSTGQLAERWVVCNMSSQGFKVSMETTLRWWSSESDFHFKEAAAKIYIYRRTSHIKERGAYLGLSHYTQAKQTHQKFS